MRLQFSVVPPTLNWPKSVARELNTRVGTCVVDRYPDREIAVQLLESVRRKEVFLMQPTDSGCQCFVALRNRLPAGLIADAVQRSMANSSPREFH